MASTTVGFLLLSISLSHILSLSAAQPLLPSLGPSRPGHQRLVHSSIRNPTQPTHPSRPQSGRQNPLARLRHQLRLLHLSPRSLQLPADCLTCSGPTRPGCNKNTCIVIPDNTITRTVTGGELTEDVISIHSTNGSIVGRPVKIHRLLFSCAHPFILNGLAKGVSGMAGFGRTRVSLPAQFAAAFSFRRKFALCLSSGTGLAFFGDVPYVFQPYKLEVSSLLSFTPLLLNPVSTANVFGPGEPSADYFIGVKSIKIDGKTVPLNSSLLQIDSFGVGGTKISTDTPYTVLESSIFEAFTLGPRRRWRRSKPVSMLPTWMCRR